LNGTFLKTAYVADRGFWNSGKEIAHSAYRGVMLPPRCKISHYPVIQRFVYAHGTQQRCFSSSSLNGREKRSYRALTLPLTASSHMNIREGLLTTNRGQNGRHHTASSLNH